VKSPLLVSALLGVSVLLSTACTTRRVAAESGGAPKAIRLVTVQLANDSEPAKYSAIIAPNAQVDLAFRVSGYVVHLHNIKGADGRIRPMEAGAPVNAGTVLARVRASDYQAVVDKARGSRDEADAGVHASEAQLTEALAGLEQAELDFERVSRLWEQESITKPAYDGSKATHDIARAKVDAAKSVLAAARQRAVSAAAQLREAEIALGDTELRAPFDGILLERHVDLGALVAPGTPAFTVADLRLVKALFNVPDTDLNNFRQSQSLDMTVDAFPGKIFHGRIVSIAAAADPRVRSFQIEVSIANPGLKLRSGMIATVQAGEVVLASQLVQIPIDALVYDPISGHYLVYGTEQRAGRMYAKEISVSPGPLAGSYVKVLEGLKPGQKIVGSGASLLRTGDPIQEVE
jgi:multidrug efflux pump subunit AcrA (membrane-fusion protein)